MVFLELPLQRSLKSCVWKRGSQTTEPIYAVPQILFGGSLNKYTMWQAGGPRPQREL